MPSNKSKHFDTNMKVKVKGKSSANKDGSPKSSQASPQIKFSNPAFDDKHDDEDALDDETFSNPANVEDEVDPSALGYHTGVENDGLLRATPEQMEEIFKRGNMEPIRPSDLVDGAASQRPTATTSI